MILSGKVSERLSGKLSGSLSVMRLPRKLLSVIAAVLVLPLLCTTLWGCHGSREINDFEIPGGFDESRRFEIVFWAKNDTNINQRRIYEQAIADFQEIYPNISVKLKSYTDYGAIYNDVITNISTGTTPNICITYPDHIATYITGENVVLPLDAIMDDPAYGLGGSAIKFDAPSKDEIQKKFLDEGIVAGRQYALPYMRSTEALYINKTYVEAMGYTVPEIATWDFIWEVSEKAMEKSPDNPDLFKVNGQNIMIPFIYKSTDNMMITMLKQKDAGYSTDKGEILIFNDTTRELLEEIAIHGGSRAFSTFKISSYPGNFFNAGRCIFAVDSTAGATWIGSHAPLSDIHESEIVEFETVVRPVPQFDPEHPQMISQGPSVCIFNKNDSQEVLASWIFAQFLLTNSVQIPYSGTEGYVPVTRTAAESAEYRDYLSRRGEDNKTYYSVKIDASKLLLDNIDNSFITPVFNGSTSLRDAAGELIENVVKSERRKETVDDAYFVKLRENVTKLYRLDQLEVSEDGGRVLGKLPAASVWLLSGLAAVWVGIGAYYACSLVKKKKEAAGQAR